MKKFGIALGSGGARGVAHFGFLEVLKENGVRIDCICGASMGAIIGALFCAGVDREMILRRIEKLRQRQIMDFDVLFFKNRGLLKQDKAMRLLKELLGDLTFEDVKIPFCCSALDLLSGHTVCLQKGLLRECVMASSSVPGVFQPMKIGEYLCVDGGVINKVPVEMCRDMGADVVLGLDVLGEIRPEPAPKNIIDTIERAFLIMNFHTGLTERQTADRLLVLDQDEINPARAEKLMLSYEIGRREALAHLEEIRAMSESCREESSEKSEEQG